MELSKTIPVVETYSWGEYPRVFLCKTEEEAVKKLRALYEEEVRVEIEENDRKQGIDFQCGIDSNGWHAWITVFCPDEEDTTEWAIGSVCE